jgi:hypothetical protein
MRTTINLADDVAAAVEQLRRERSIGLSEAVNELARSGLAHQEASQPRFVQRTHKLGLKIDVTDVAEALEQLEGPTWR